MLVVVALAAWAALSVLRSAAPKRCRRRAPPRHGCRAAPAERAGTRPRCAARGKARDAERVPVARSRRRASCGFRSSARCSCWSSAAVRKRARRVDGRRPSMSLRFLVAAACCCLVVPPARSRTPTADDRRQRVGFDQHLTASSRPTGFPRRRQPRRAARRLFRIGAGGAGVFATSVARPCARPSSAIWPMGFAAAACNPARSTGSSSSASIQATRRRSRRAEGRLLSARCGTMTPDAAGIS